MTETISAINALPRDEFVARLGHIFEHSPWVAEGAFSHRPFPSVDALHAAMLRTVLSADRKSQFALVCGHPQLAGREAIAGDVTQDSAGEQGRLGLTALTAQEHAEMGELNRRYFERFGFPCIIALKLHESRATVIGEMSRRVDGLREAEFSEALIQISHITRARLEKLFGE